MIDKYVLTNPSEDELGSAVQENLYALFRSMKVLPGCVLIENDSLSLHYSFPANPFFKGVWRTHLSPEETETKIDEVVNWFNQHGAPYFFWWTDSQTQPVDMAERLTKRGFDGNLEGNPGMAANLLELRENFQIPSSIKIIQAIKQESLEDWRDAFAEAFEIPVSDGQAWVDATLSLGKENVPWKLYVGYLEQKPVSTSLLFYGAGVAGLYAIGTIPRARNKGIGTAITLKPLLDAHNQDYNFAVLFSSRMGYAVYKRLGFREVVCKIGKYYMELDH
jgi:hypothetical protein